MRNLIVKLAVFGMGCALCFGTAACGAEDLIPPMPEEAAQKRITNEVAEQSTTGDAKQSTTEVEQQETAGVIGDWDWLEFTVKGETTKREEIPYDSIQEDGPHIACEDGIHCLYSNNMEQHSGTIQEEDGKYIITFEDGTWTMIGTVSGDVLTVVNEKGTKELIFQRRDENLQTAEVSGMEAEVSDEETAVAEAPVVDVPWEDDIATRYMATYVISGKDVENKIIELGYEEYAGYFNDTDTYIDVVLDLKDDGTAFMYYNFDRWFNIMKEILDNNFEDMVITIYEKQGVSREALETQMRARGFRNLEDAIGILKRAYMRELDQGLQERFQNYQDIKVNLAWTQEGDTLQMEELGELKINADGSFNYTLPADKSVDGNPYDLRFVPVSRPD